MTPPPLLMFPLQIVKFLWLSQEKAAAVVQLSMDANNFKLCFKIYIWDI